MMTRMVIGIVAAAFASLAHAQDASTLGELLAKGGKRLTKDEVTKLYGDEISVSGIVGATGRRRAENTYKKDGTMFGRSTDLGGQNGYGLTGTWTINNPGELCTQLRSAQSGADVTPNPPCSFVYRLNDTHYSGRSDDPNSAVYPRTIKK
jgi:hypothetical protein